MKLIYDEIIQLIQQKGSNLDMNTNAISYSQTSDPGTPVKGYSVSGIRETINIPDEYMKKAGATNAVEFLQWLKSA
jgi:hypothetical protein